ncbi:MAG: PD40 domain-containing protein [Anaerolineales bacterium]|nr:PD40 domain-containing protein [Anaerolineales bacterium]
MVENINNLDFHNQLPIQLTSGKGDEFYPIWSPACGRILYTSTGNGNKDLTIVHPNGSNPSPVVDSPADKWNARWSPDSTQIVYSCFNFDSALIDLYIYEFDSGSWFPITSDNFDDWLPA